MDFERLNPSSTAKHMANHPQTTGLQKLWYPPYLLHAGACGLGIKKSLHDQVAGFDESFLQVMDTDYCLRIQQKGIPLHFASEALVYIRCRTTGGSFSQVYLWGEYNTLLYKRYRQAGTAEWWRWKAHAKGWLKTILTMPKLRSPDGRKEWIHHFGWQMGMLKGSIKYFVPPLPIP
jgi:GT2 family glycosyltransferase